MLAVVLIGVLVTRAGLRNGVERITKVMMIALFAVLAVLVVRAVTLPGAQEGLAFYLMPDFGKLFAGGWGTFADAVFAAKMCIRDSRYSSGAPLPVAAGCCDLRQVLARLSMKPRMLQWRA